MADPRPTSGTPPWVKVFGVVLALLIVAFVAAMAAGLHDPSRWGHGL